MLARPHRLTVRTLGSHPNNRGSIPREVTKYHRRVGKTFSFFKKKHSSGQKSGNSGLSSQSDAVINTISDGVTVIDRDGIIKLFNKSAAVMTGWAVDDALELNFNSIFQFFDASEHPIDNQHNPILIAMGAVRQAKLDDVLLKTNSGKYIQVSIQATPIGDNEADKHSNETVKPNVVVTFRDITSQQKELRQQSDFVSTASHEMRTPVAIIEGYLGMLLNPATATVDARGLTYAQKAHESAQHLGHLFQDLLDVTKLDDNRMRNTPILVDAGAAARQAVDQLQSQAVAKGLKLSFETTGQLQPMYIIYVDIDHLQEVLDNLISNAIKYTKQGSIKVSVNDENQKVRISVTDTGIGVPSEDVPHLFQKFYRVDSSDTREIGGTGLGLYLIKKLTEYMGGKVGVISEYGQGSTFWIEFDRLNREQALSKAREIKARERQRLN